MTKQSWSEVDQLIEDYRRRTLEKMLRLYGPAPNINLVLRRVIEARDGPGVEEALFLAGHLRVQPDKDILKTLLFETWHRRHEDIVFDLAQRRDPELADVFYRATQLVLDYLDYDDAKALAVKAIYGLGRLRTEKADAMLRELENSNSEPLRNAAKRQFELREEQTARKRQHTPSS